MVKTNIQETRRMSASELRSLCIRNQWFTDADNDAYERFLRLSGNGRHHVTTAVLCTMAVMVQQYSTPAALDGRDVTGIMYELARICHTTFEEVQA